MLLVSIIPVHAEVPVGHLDKVVHLCQYLVFAWLLIQTVRASAAPQGGIPSESQATSRDESRDRMPELAPAPKVLVWGREYYLWWAWIYATSYGLLIEMIQAMLPWRSAEAADIFANALGAWLGVLVGQRIPHQR